MKKLTIANYLLALSILCFGANISASTSLTLGPNQGSKPSTRAVTLDIHNGDQFSTGQAEIRELILPNGTSLTMGPDSTLRIESYNPDMADHPLTLSVERGRYRIVGGRADISPTIVVHSPTATLQLEDASVVIEVKANGETRAWLLAGRELRMTQNQQSKSLLRPGYDLLASSDGKGLQGPTPHQKDTALVDMIALNSAQLTCQSEEEESNPCAVKTRGGSAGDSIASNTQVNLQIFEDQSGGLLANRGRGSSSNPGLVILGRPEDPTDSLPGNDGFDPGSPTSFPSLNDNQPSQTDVGFRFRNAQVRDSDISDTTEEKIRVQGETTNRLFNSKENFIQTSLLPMPLDNKTGSNSKPDPNNLIYVFFGLGNKSSIDAGFVNLNLGLTGLTDFNSNPVPLPSKDSTIELNSPVALLHLNLPSKGHVTDPIRRKYNDPSDLENASGIGGITADGADFQLLQAGFSFDDPPSSNDIARDQDNFLLLEARPFSDAKDHTEQFLFAAGDVDKGRINPETGLKTEFMPSFSIDRFFISPGLSGFNEKSPHITIASGNRPFLRKATDLGLNLTDTGLYVVNPNSNDPSSILHTDFALKGTGSRQQSTLSVTLGSLDYQLDQCFSCDIQDSYEVVVNGRTTGSSWGSIKDKIGLVSFSSPLINTSAGGGNPDLNRNGYAGYLVLENFDPNDNSINGGTERPLGSSASSENYSFLRLATATGTSSDQSDRTTQTLNGWVAGLALNETDPGISVSQIDTDQSPDNFSLKTDKDSHRVTSTVNFFKHQSITLGGPNAQNSTYVDGDKFAARSNTVETDVVLVNGEMIKAGFDKNMRDKIGTYQYLKWGVLSGMTNSNPNLQEHVHLATWIAGQKADASNFPTTGTASYSGHAIGNVFNRGAFYTQVGTFNNHWDFAKRTGTADLNFDGSKYKGNTQLLSNTVNFNGAINSSANVGSLHGNFVQGGGYQYRGVVGRFSINEKVGKPTYRASGTFGAEKK